jgi:hypothetical protein
MSLLGCGRHSDLSTVSGKRPSAVTIMLLNPATDTAKQFRSHHQPA